MSKSSGRNLRIWIIVGVVVLISALVIANIFMKRKPEGKKVDVAFVEVDSLVQTVSASGKIQPEVDVNISANVSGRILFLGAQEGEAVEKGKLLVRIEDENYTAALEQNRYALASAEASLQEARSNLKRTAELHDDNLASDAQLEGAQATLKRFEADVDRVRANVAQSQDALDKTRIYSPISGIVTRLNKEIGEMAIGATFSEDVIMVVAQLERMEVNVEVNENDVILIELEDMVDIEVFAMPSDKYKGIVTEIAHSGIIRGQGSAEEVTNFEVKVAIVDKVKNLRPGMSATVEIITDERESAVVVPQEAITVRSLDDEKKKEQKARSSVKSKKKGKGDMEFGKDDEISRDDLTEVVYVAKDDSAWVREVELGIYSDTHFEIVSGLEEGELIITGPFKMLSRDLHSGDRVEYDEPKKDEDGSDGSEVKKKDEN
ncbi:efflux RND transporter periplasmic adaptor subunit [bacterium]|nr:efflux RND transporter periplasmic adaptor subunit [bacterium]